MGGSGMQVRRRVRLVSSIAALTALLAPAWPAEAQYDECVELGIGCDDSPGTTVPTTAPGTVPTTLPGSTGAPGTTATTATTTPSATPSSSTAVATPTTVSAGQSVTVRGTGPFAPNQPLQVSFDSVPPTALAPARSDAAGAYVATVSIPSTASSGSHRITVSGPGAQGGNHQSIATITIGALAVTGVVTDIMVIAGIAVLALGLLLLRRSQWSLPVSTANWVPSRRRR